MEVLSIVRDGEDLSTQVNEWVYTSRVCSSEQKQFDLNIQKQYHRLLLSVANNFGYKVIFTNSIAGLHKGKEKEIILKDKYFGKHYQEIDRSYQMCCLNTLFLHELVHALQFYTDFTKVVLPVSFKADTYEEFKGSLIDLLWGEGCRPHKRAIDEAWSMWLTAKHIYSTRGDCRAEIPAYYLQYDFLSFIKLFKTYK